VIKNLDKNGKERLILKATVSTPTSAKHFVVALLFLLSIFKFIIYNLNSVVKKIWCLFLFPFYEKTKPQREN
jgi:hypothetical protein